MTRDKKAKAAARALKASANVPYTVARRLTPAPDDNEADYQAPSIEKLLEPYLQGICDNLIDEPIGSLGQVEMEGQLDISEASVHQLEVDTDTIDVHIV